MSCGHFFHTLYGETNKMGLRCPRCGERQRDLAAAEDRATAAEDRATAAVAVRDTMSAQLTEMSKTIDGLKRELEAAMITNSRKRGARR